MKENNNSFTDSEEEINTNSNNKYSEHIDFSLKEKIFFNSYIKDENNNIDENEIDNNINLEEIKIGSRIICPEENCFQNTILSIEPYSFEIKSDCGKHINKMSIIKYVENSGAAKEEKECCSVCNTTYKDILQNNKKLYKCYCGRNVCETCKNGHLSGKNEKEHNSIEFDKKDYICCCSKDFKKYLVFCINCKKNICILCNNKHKDHKLKKFSELYKLGKEEKKEIKQKLDEQKEKIEKIKKIIDNWMIKTQKFFDIYKKKLELYWEINNLIFNKYDVSKNYYEEIKNIENIRFDFDSKLLDLLDSENDFKKQNEIFVKILNEDYVDDINKNNEINNNNEINKNNKYEYQLDNLFEKQYGEMIVNNICELKKDKLLIVNVSGKNKKEELYVYSQSELNIYNQEVFNKPIDGGHIISISELKNGNILIVQNNNFKIAKIEKETKIINIIQDKNIEPEIFKQIIELINGNLASISYIPNQDNYIIIWEKNLMYDEYERKKINHIDELPHYLMELNKISFLVYFENEKLSIFNSKTNEEIKKLPKIKTINTEKPSYKVFNMIRINENIIMFVYPNGVLLYNLLLKRYTKIFALNYIVKDICYLPNDKEAFFINYFESKKNQRKATVKSFGLIPLIYDLFLQKVKLGNEILDIHRSDIKCVKLLSNNYLITGSSDNFMKIWKITKK
jgi:WD40 repeat protein